MAAKCNPALRQYKCLPVFIEEDHNDVVPHIHRAIASRHLPMWKVPMVHFDSHPDLLLPLHMQADHVFDKESLYSGMSIENWILPLVYAGHVNEVYWLKPPWANQLPESSNVEFSVGKWKETGELRITLDDPYFLTEALYAPESQMTDVKHATLHVITVTPPDWTDADSSASSNRVGVLNHGSTSSVTSSQGYLESCSTENEFDSGGLKSTVPGSGRRLQKQECLKRKSDCVENCDTNEEQSKSVEIPNKSGEKHAKLNTELTAENSKIGDCCAVPGKLRDTNGEGPGKSCEERIGLGQADANNMALPRQGEICVQSTPNQTWLRELREKLGGRPYILDVDLDFYSTKDPFQNECSPDQSALLQKLFEFNLPRDRSEKSTVEFTQARQLQLDELDAVFQQLQQNPQCRPKVTDAQRQELLDKLVSLLQSDACRATPVDFEMLYRAGCTFDGTALPHHVSSTRQIQQLMDSTVSILKSLPPPTIITVARSSVDDYCPQDQVETIQENLLKVFQDIYEAIDVKKLYEEQQ